MKRKCYGDTKTKLVLTDKAYDMYCSTDPLSIYERKDGLYDMDGSLIMNGLTAEQTNEVLEEFYEED